MKFECDVFDRYEGRVKVTVEVNSEAEAYDEALIYAAELGCCCVEDVEFEVVG